MKTLNRRDFGVAVVAAILLPATTARADDDDMEVHIDNFVFQPAELKIKLGTTVTWTNRDDIPHTVVSAGKFRSKALDTDDKFSFTFTNAGDYKYFCSLHPHMTGMIKVE
ncbi:cupredoxin family copper-binding protein [Bradyrhizobium sp. 61]|uniref:cupredoxin domain-containing protein n=1 Tax=unclassified Bradyrhizobium TaxID=2631580 RepID=UPI001FF70BBE|nr:MULTISPECIES: cupredoxin family copper-binding protein [unclassified Bradyrhizobium]MCK1280445.1 cupredoxin family copper-binding protein [Bradyrhizobium sp. 61]MCK1444233.1 cupredoxin family copper-binding protein [Bradyrhizobium sp. 48]MCK1462477.1 cupredoxin family copper-binding protein [Bradyrhizobium sp. 2]